MNEKGRPKRRSCSLSTGCLFSPPAGSALQHPNNSSHSWLKPGAPVWVPDSHQHFVKATVVNFNRQSSTVIVSESLDNNLNLLSFPLSRIYPADAHFLFGDHTQLTYFNHPNILENIRQRFDAAAKEPQKLAHFVYSQAGALLLAVNPYSTLGDYIYSEEWLDFCSHESTDTKSSSPHPFKLAHAAYRKLLQRGIKTQNIIISGESGAGKTETSKHVMQFLAWASDRHCSEGLVGGPHQTGAYDINTKVLRSNPILEFFGNAKTTRNDNSSRFGKLMRMFFADNGRLMSATIQTYLLAKSRVVKVPVNEENYHIFYSILAGLPQARLRDLHLHPNFPSRYLPDAHNPDVEVLPSISSQGRHRSAYTEPHGTFHIHRLLQAFDAFKLNNTIVNGIFRILAAILYLGTVEFVEKSDDKAASYSCAGCFVENRQNLRIVIDLLGFEHEASIERLEEILVSKQIYDTRSNLSQKKAINMLDSLAKGLYEALFNYVVQLLVSSISGESPDEDIPTKMSTRFQKSAQPSQTPCESPRTSSIGVLDVFGFENLEPNSFEQLCINYANERLQLHTMQEIVSKEQELWRNEGIVVRKEEMSNCENSAVSQCTALDVLTGTPTNPGIFSILDECTQLNSDQGDRDKVFAKRVQSALAKYDAQHGLRRMVRPAVRKSVIGNPDGAHQFAVRHFAEPVFYSAEEFVDKNIDVISEELRSFLESGSGCHVKALFPSFNQGGVKQKINALKGGNRSLSGDFIRQMNNLISRLSQSTCHFIRCIKPNTEQRPYLFESAFVLRQLITGGIMSVVDVMKHGYPCRISYHDLRAKIRHDHLPPDVTSRELALCVCEALKLDESFCAFGATKAFFKFGAVEEIEKIENASSVEELEKFSLDVWRCYKKSKQRRVLLTVKYVIVFRRLILKIKLKRLARQAAVHYNEVFMPKKREEAAFRICRYIEGYIERFQFLQKRAAAQIIEKYWKSYVTRAAILEYLEADIRERAALLIQKWWRRQHILRKENFRDVGPAEEESLVEDVDMRDDVLEDMHSIDDDQTSVITGDENFDENRADLSHPQSAERAPKMTKEVYEFSIVGKTDQSDVSRQQEEWGVNTVCKDVTPVSIRSAISLRRRLTMFLNFDLDEELQKEETSVLTAEDSEYRFIEAKSKENNNRRRSAAMLISPTRRRTRRSSVARSVQEALILDEPPQYSPPQLENWYSDNNNDKMDQDYAGGGGSREEDYVHWRNDMTATPSLINTTTRTASSHKRTYRDCKACAVAAALAANAGGGGGGASSVGRATKMPRPKPDATYIESLIPTSPIDMDDDNLIVFSPNLRFYQTSIPTLF